MKSVPLCDVCWELRCLARDEVGREPVRINANARGVEHCDQCGRPTFSGIYVVAET